MIRVNTNGQTIGGSADILTRMSEERLIKLWHDTAAKLSDINPIEDYETYAYYRVLFDTIVKTYYQNFEGGFFAEDKPIEAECD